MLGVSSIIIDSAGREVTNETADEHNDSDIILEPVDAGK